MMLSPLEDHKNWDCPVCGKAMNIYRGECCHECSLFRKRLKWALGNNAESKILPRYEVRQLIAGTEWTVVDRSYDGLVENEGKFFCDTIEAAEEVAKKLNAKVRKK